MPTIRTIRAQRGHNAGTYGSRKAPKKRAKIPPYTFMTDLMALKGDALSTALLWAAEAEWSKQALADVLCVSRQAVQSRISRARYRHSVCPIPIPERN